MMSTRSRGAGAALATVALLLLAGCSTAPSERSLGQPGFGVEGQKLAVAWEDVSVSIDELVPVAEPVRLSIPALDIDMGVEPHGLDDRGQMSLPRSPFTAGWYSYAAAPASDEGATVIAAHVDSLDEGRGPFAQLRTAEVGTEVSITDTDGAGHVYRIVSVERIPKGEVPWDQYFSTTGAPRLVLVTCGGEYDPGYASGVGRYEDNYIVTAERVS
ncbi:class F sortase [Microcella sp.]|uniref:class F sortase n=1 Tax=Microcella sp. TaxID=1913979 RepID=UPI003F6EA97F